MHQLGAQHNGRHKRQFRIAQVVGIWGGERSLPNTPQSNSAQFSSLNLRSASTVRPKTAVLYSPERIVVSISHSSDRAQHTADHSQLSPDTTLILPSTLGMYEEYAAEVAEAVLPFLQVQIGNPSVANG